MWFADARPMDAGCPSRIRTSVHGSKVRCPTTRRRGSGPKGIWSGRRDSNPRPSPWQGDALPTEPLPLERSVHPMGGAESQDRTGDTAIFSRVLYQLSYLGPMANQPSAARRRVERYHGPPEASNRRRSEDRSEPLPRSLLQPGQAGRFGCLERRLAGQRAESVDPIEDGRMRVHQPG
jgi:hypothetical protein